MSTAAPDPPSTLVVNLDADADLRLLDALSASHPSGSSFAQSCVNLLRSSGHDRYLSAVASDEHAVSAMVGSEEYMGMLSIWAAGLERVGGADDNGGPIVMEMANALAGKDRGSSVGLQVERARRLEMLATLYNLTPGSSTSPKIPLLLLLIQLSTTMGRGDGNDGSFAALHRLADSLLLQISPLLDRWESPLSQRRALYLAAADALTESGRAADGQNFLLKYLASFPEGSAETRQRATEAILGGLSDPIGQLLSRSTADHGVSLLSLPPIRDLISHPDTAPLLRLLDIYSSGSLDDYRALTSETSSAAVLKAHGIDVQEGERNMRLLSLCSLAAESTATIPGNESSGGLSYASVAEALRIREDEVEPWIVSAVRRGLVDAKMDQIEKRVVVERAMVRKFGKAQWVDLGNRLRAWREAVKGVLDGMAGDAAVEKLGASLVDQ